MILGNVSETICTLCHRKRIKRCEDKGEMEYSDGSSLICPNWNKRLNEINGMTPAEADQEALYQMQFR